MPAKQHLELSVEVQIVTFLRDERLMLSIAAQCLRVRSGLFSPNLISQSACKMSLALACVVIILHDDWSISLGENRLNRGLKHLAAKL